MTKIILKDGSEIKTKLTLEDIENQLFNQSYIVIRDNNCIVAETEFKIIKEETEC